MKKPPGYYWIPANHPETASMTREQHLCYRILWDYCCTLEGLPKDPFQLGVISGYSPAKEFEKAIWSRLKEEFYLDAEGKWQMTELSKQRNKDKKFRSAQGKRRKGKRNHNLEQSPAEIQAKTESNPIVTEAWRKAEFKTPAEIPQNPPVIQSEDIPIRTEPAEFRPLSEPESEIVSVIEPEKNAAPESLPDGPKIEITNCKPAALEPHFDPYAAWLEFSDAYPEKDLIKNKMAMDLFLKDIQRPLDYGKLLRSLASYKAQIGKPGFREPEPFLDWFSVWQTWEDWDTMPKNQLTRGDL